MSTPHMTGRGSAASAAGETRSAADLLDDDGNIDLSEVYSVTNKHNAHADGRLSARDAEEIRQALLRGSTTAAVGEMVGANRRTVGQHAKGRVDYPGEEPPETPPLTFDRTEGWRVADE